LNNTLQEELKNTIQNKSRRIVGKEFRETMFSDRKIFMEKTMSLKNFVMKKNDSDLQIFHQTSGHQDM